MGRSAVTSPMSATKTLTSHSPRTQACYPNPANQILKLPDATACDIGHTIYVINYHGSNQMLVRDFDNGVVKTLVANRVLKCVLRLNTTTAGKWVTVTRILSS